MNLKKEGILKGRIKLNNKNKNRYQISKIKFKNRIHILFDLIKIYMLIVLIDLIKTKILYDNIKCLFVSQFSTIVFKINGTGAKNILGHNQDYYFGENYYLEKVFINGNKQKSVNYLYILMIHIIPLN